MSDRITRGRNAIFGHVARLPDNVPAHQAMLRQVELSVGRPPDPTWKRRPGRPRTPNGPTNSAAITTMFPLRLCGGKLLVAAVTRERRCGLSRLRVGDDDDFHTVLWFLPLKRPLSGCSSSTNISSYGLCDAEHSH